MKEKDLPIDRSRHAIYTKKAKQCVQKLLYRYYDEKTASELWEKNQLQYADFLKDEPALGGVKRHHLEDVLPLMCNCDHLAMQKLHAVLIREGTCGISECCDYCIVGDRTRLLQTMKM